MIEEGCGSILSIILVTAGVLLFRAAGLVATSSFSTVPEEGSLFLEEKALPLVPPPLPPPRPPRPPRPPLPLLAIAAPEVLLMISLPSVLSLDARAAAADSLKSLFMLNSSSRMALFFGSIALGARHSTIANLVFMEGVMSMRTLIWAVEKM